MNKEKAIKISWYIFLAAMAVLTILFFLDIKFVVVGINILVLDALTAGVWIFARLCKWAGCKNTGKRTLAVIALTLVGLLAVFSLFISGGYIEGTEPQTRRTFVVEYQGNMFNNGSAKLYERFGPLLLACDVEEYEGEFLHARPEERQIYISEDGKKIVVAFFFLHPVFVVPLEQPVQAEKTPEQVLAEQPIDDTHDAFLVDTGGELGTLLITAELAEQSKNELGARDITFSVWNPAEMEQPIQTFTEEAMTGVAPEFHHVVDANFDGFQDFGYLFDGNQPYYWHYWLWNEGQKQFRYYAPLTEVPNSEFEAEQQVVTGWLRSGAASGTHTLYHWMNGELTLARAIKFDCFDQNIQSVMIEDWLDGEMVAEYQRECEFGSEEYDMLSNWFDLDYHGEPKEENTQ